MGYLAPSILSADVLDLQSQVKAVEENGADFIHVDVMDGRFVPNLTFGPFMVQALKRVTSLPLDVHLMVQNPDHFIREFAEAGAAIITVHQEACPHLDRTVQAIHENGCKAGVSINPATPVHTLEPILNKLDLILIMSVNPGFGGQKFISYSLNKIRSLRFMLAEQNPNCLLEVDGGLNLKTAPSVVEAGADVLVAGNAIFSAPSIGEATRSLKRIAQNAVKEA